MSRAATALVTLLLSSHAAMLHAQPITSFEPDTTRRDHRAPPPGTVELPVWIASDVSPLAPYVSAANDPRRTLVSPWIGVAVAWPVERWRRWIEFGYAHWDLRRTELTRPFATRSLAEQQPLIDEVVYRTGIDRIAGSPTHPWAFAGVGAGLGSGWISSRFASEQSEALASFEVDARAGFILQPNDHSRVTLFASGGPVYELSVADLTGALYRIELHVAFEQRIRIQKRLLPAP